jgi:hypothetical protein
MLFAFPNTVPSYNKTCSISCAIIMAQMHFHPVSFRNSFRILRPFIWKNGKEHLFYCVSVIMSEKVDIHIFNYIIDRLQMQKMLEIAHVFS